MFTSEELTLLAHSVEKYAVHWLKNSDNMAITKKRRQDFYDLYIKLKHLHKKVLNQKEKVDE